MGARGFGNAFLFPHVLFGWWGFFVLLSDGARGLSSGFFVWFFFLMYFFCNKVVNASSSCA